MLQTLAVQNYRTLRDFVIPLSPLNLITGAKGSGKSNIYKALRLLSETAQGGVIGSLAREGGLASTSGVHRCKVDVCTSTSNSDTSPAICPGLGVRMS